MRTCKLCRWEREGRFTIMVAKTLFSEGYNVSTIIRMLSLEGYEVPRSTFYNHYSKHVPIMETRKSNRSFRLQRHGKGTKPIVEAVSPKIIEMMEACK